MLERAEPVHAVNKGYLPALSADVWNVRHQNACECAPRTVKQTKRCSSLKRRSNVCFLCNRFHACKVKYTAPCMHADTNYLQYHVPDTSSFTSRLHLD